MAATTTVNITVPASTITDLEALLPSMVNPETADKLRDIIHTIKRGSKRKRVSSPPPREVIDVSGEDAKDPSSPVQSASRPSIRRCLSAPNNSPVPLHIPSVNVADEFVVPLGPAFSSFVVVRRSIFDQLDPRVDGTKLCCSNDIDRALLTLRDVPKCPHSV